MIADLILQVAKQYNKEQVANNAGNNSVYRHRPSNSSFTHDYCHDTRCLRQMVYQSLGFPQEDLAGRAVLVFDDSSWHEELTKNWIDKSIIKLHSSQMKVDCIQTIRGQQVSGSIDGILTLPTGEDILFEHKAINCNSWERYAKGDPTELPWDYLAQCAIYINGLNKFNPEIKKACLLMKNKNTSAYLEYLLSYDFKTDTLSVNELITSQRDIVEIHHNMVGILDNILKKWDEVDTYSGSKKLPLRPYPADNWRCQYCGYKNQCQNTDRKTEFEVLQDSGKVIEDKKAFDLIDNYFIQKAEKSRLESQARKFEKDLDFMKLEIENLMLDLGLKKAVCGKYSVNLTQTERELVDKELVNKNAFYKKTYTNLKINESEV